MVFWTSNDINDDMNRVSFQPQAASALFPNIPHYSTKNEALLKCPSRRIAYRTGDCGCFLFLSPHLKPVASQDFPTAEHGAILFRDRHNTSVCDERRGRTVTLKRRDSGITT